MELAVSLRASCLISHVASWSTVAFLSFMSFLTSRRRVTSVAISRGRMPWSSDSAGGSGTRSSVSDRCERATVVKQILYS